MNGQRRRYSGHFNDRTPLSFPISLATPLLSLAELSVLKSTSRYDQSARLLKRQVGNRIIRKRIHVRVEHVQPSRCAEEIKLRRQMNDKLKARGEVISTKKQPQGPKPGFMVEGATLETDTPNTYDVVNDLKGGY